MSKSTVAWLQASPLAAVFVVFFLVPLALIVMVSFWRATDYELIPAFTLQSYLDLFNEVTLRTYLSTLKFSVLVWLLTLAIPWVTRPVLLATDPLGLRAGAFVDR